MRHLKPFKAAETFETANINPLISKNKKKIVLPGSTFAL